MPHKLHPSLCTCAQSVGRITTVGAKVVSELALYLAFNTAYFITNTYQYLSKEEQQLLAKETVDKCEAPSIDLSSTQEWETQIE